jgi:hypothetical protein
MELIDLLLPGTPEAASIASALRRWRDDADAWPARLEPFAASLRRRSWDAMGAEIAGLVDAVYG